MLARALSISHLLAKRTLRAFVPFDAANGQKYPLPVWVALFLLARPIKR